MDKIHYDRWPVVSVCDFERIEFDAMEHDGGYTGTIVFIKKFSDNEDGSGAQGMALATHMWGETLQDLYVELLALVDTGFFYGMTVGSEGNLWSTDGQDRRRICWHCECGDGDSDDHGELEVSLFPGTSTIH